MNSKNEYFDLLIESEALLEGHFILTSGLHSNKYIQCALALQWPDKCIKLAEGIIKLFNKSRIDTVIGPALGGITIAYEIGRQLNAKAIFTERVDGKATLRRGFHISKGERVLIVEDVVTTAGSALEVANVVESYGGDIIGISSIVDRRPDKKPIKYDFKSLVSLDVPVYNPEDCPLCKQGVPLVKPGSRGLK